MSDVISSKVIIISINCVYLFIINGFYVISSNSVNPAIMILGAYYIFAYIFMFYKIFVSKSSFYSLEK